jgi:hypothetical protein
MEAAVAARIRFNASTAAGDRIFSRACPEIGAYIFPHAGAKIEVLIVLFGIESGTLPAHKRHISAIICRQNRRDHAQGPNEFAAPMGGGSACHSFIWRNGSRVNAGKQFAIGW